MSGICAVFRNAGPESIRMTLAAMNAGLVLDREHCKSEPNGQGGVGVAARFAEQQVYRGTRVLLACDAQLINTDELTAVVDNAHYSHGGNTASLLAALYERFGPSFVERLRGGFSVVLWDSLERLLLAAIDGFGIKRLAYYQDAHGVLVASRVDALAHSGQIDTTINPRAIANVLNFSANLGPETIFEKIRRLPPGTLLLASPRETRLEIYWDMQYGLAADSNEARLSREMESVIHRSVAAHCRHDSLEELGAFLSGGTDSSTVVGMMTRATKAPVNAFSIGFTEQSFDELAYAELAAKRFGARHYTFLVGPHDCLEALPHMVRSFDEPYGNSSAIPTYFCARLAAQNGVRVLLAGDGGDELFGGNERYATDKLFEIYHNVPRIIRKGLLEPGIEALAGNGGLAGRARRYVRRANIRGVERMLSFQFLRTHALETVFAADFLHALGGYSVLDLPSLYYARTSAHDHLDRLMYVDMKITLADNDLPKVTCMSELAGIQTRFPFLDRSVAEFSGRIPSRLKVKGFKKRYLFKRAFRELLPPEIIFKKKHGFGIPVAVWMKTDRQMQELARDTLCSARATTRGYFRRAFIEDLFRRHASEETTYYGDTLWTFLSIELWHLHSVNKVGTVAS